MPSRRLDAQDIQALANDPDVESISADADVTATATQETSGSSTHDGSGTSVVGLKQAFGLDSWFSGSTATVAVIDSGFRTPPTFQAAWSVRTISPAARAECRLLPATSTVTARMSPV